MKLLLINLLLLSNCKSVCVTLSVKGNERL